ncbi:SpoIIE family protein phosphatase, partial [Candidatus Bathyarchaeota archaeon]|nr:SpoIIE family protein phosphatase [Candidatus Bathyarchaeota archaeon]
MTKHLLVAFWISGCCMVLTALSAQAHNGAVAIAVPLEGIVIDGDLSDWPEGMRVYPIACPITRMPENEEDFKGSFRIGYNEDESAIFLAVEMLDESVVARTKIERRINDDACQLFLDSSHKEGEHPTRVFLISGNSSEASGNDVNLEDYQAEVQRTEYGHQFEWRVDLGLESGFHPGMSLGVNILLHDKDAEDPVSIMSWGNTGGWASGGLGDVVLIEAEGELGELTGRLIWENGKGVARGRMRIVSSELWMTVGADQSGVFSVEIPAGNYRVSSVIESVEEIDAVVGKGEIHQVGEQVVPAPKGKTINIVPDKKTESQGTRKAAGSGRWQGRWQMLDVGDGLPDPTVTDILQDKEGFLWFSTMGGGVSRYDGNEFAHYTEADGLGANGVKCMLEDREGNLWFGVTHGIGFGIPETGYLTRFDGRYMTRFPLESDLSGNRINALEEDQEGNLWIGLNGGLIRYDGDEFVHFSEADGLVSDRVFDVAVGNRGELWVGTQGGLIRYDGESFDNFTPEDGPFYRVLEIEKSREGELWWGSLTGCVSRNVIQQFSTKSIEVESTDAEVYAIREDGQGNMWIGMNGGGVMLYDGSEWDTFTSMDGAEGDRVMAIYEDRGRDVWIGTGTWVGDSSIAGMGVRRFVGEEWTTYTTADGLPSNGVMSVLEDRKGNIWVGTWEGACWYDGREFRKLDDLIGNVFAIMEDSRGNIWFGTIDRGVYTFDGERVVHFQQEGYLDDSNIIAFLEDREGNIWMGGRGGGARKYDGEKLTVYTVADGLENNTASAFWEDQKGDIWIGAGRWASRYDGEKFISISTADGLIEGDINAFLEDRKGNIWIGTSGGISKYDGEKFTSFTVADGLAHSHVQDIIEDEQGHLWFATYGGGISRYDGRIFQTLLKQDGLAHNGTQEILQDSRGDFWIPNEGGLTRFRPRPTPPPVRLTRILADGEYEPTEEISFPASQDYLAFEFVGSSFKTRSNQMAYAYILEGYDTDWGQTRERRAVYRDLPVGDYVFKVKAVDRDLTYSTEPAVVRVVVHLPYVRISLIGGLAIAMVGFVVALGYGIGKRRDQRQAERALMQELEDELQTAHDLQMGLMPTSSPQIAGFDIAGRCLTANHVGGDYFQYFQEDDRFLVCLADVTGHAMEAAIPALVFDGILRTEMHEFQTPGQLFTRLNQTLCKTLETRTFVCFCAVEIDR